MQPTSPPPPPPRTLKTRPPFAWLENIARFWTPPFVMALNYIVRLKLGPTILALNEQRRIVVDQQKQQQQQPQQSQQQQKVASSNFRASNSNARRRQQQQQPPTQTLRPVLLIIHGGDSFDFGSGNTLEAEKYVQQERQLVVTFNYRLNIFGEYFFFRRVCFGFQFCCCCCCCFLYLKPCHRQLFS